MQPVFHTNIELSSDTRAGIISDLHLGPEDPDTASRFRSFLNEFGDSMDVLLILGDLFEYWIGDDAASLCGHLDTIQALATFIGRSNCRVYVMHGNRDFLLGPRFASETGCELLADPCILHHGNVPILLSHGDDCCTDDIDHQRFRAMVRDPHWQESFLALSQSERLDYARQARAQSESGKAGKTLEIMDVNPRAITDTMYHHGVRHMIHGHTHRPAIHTLEIDGIQAYRFVLGDWSTRSSHLIVENGEIRYAPSDAERIVRLS